MSYMNTLLFGIFPYIAIVTCLVAGWVRFDREQYTWKAGSSQMLRKKGMGIASNWFHVGIILVLAGHFVGLLVPYEVYHHVISTENKQLLAMVFGGIFGAICFVGLTMLLYRRITDPRVSATGTFSDLAILIMLYIQLILGMLTIVASTNHLDGSAMTLLGTWAQSIVTLQPFKAAAAIYTVDIIYKLHVFFGMAIILIAPFTRLVHVVSAPIWYFGRNYQIVRQKNHL